MRENAAMRLPLLVVVTGMPSSGKTTVAEGLASELCLPLIAKDEIKECLYENLGARDVSSSGRIGAAAYALIFTMAREMLSSGVSVVIEANFFRGQEADFASLPEHNMLQLHCDAPLGILLERYANRTRHAGHHDAEKITELPGRFESGVHSPLDIEGDLIQLDTTQPMDMNRLAERIRTLL